MKAILLSFIAISFSLLSVAQTDTSKVKNFIEVVEQPVFTFVEQMPEFPGGNDSLFSFIRRTIEYPRIQADTIIQGRVIVQFIVDETGQVGEVKVKRSLHPVFDAEAVRVTKLLPPFKPGMQQGKYVKVYYMLPYSFKL